MNLFVNWTIRNDYLDLYEMKQNEINEKNGIRIVSDEMIQRKISNKQ